MPYLRFGTYYAQLLADLNGIKIRIADNDNPLYNSVASILEYENNRLFEIYSNEEAFYVGASFFKVYENNLSFKETSLGMVYKGRDKEIARSF